VPSEILNAVRRDGLLKIFMSQTKEYSSTEDACKEQHCEAETPTTVFIDTARRALGQWLESLSTAGGYIKLTLDYMCKYLQL
jgi:hypothetical protein